MAAEVDTTRRRALTVRRYALASVAAAGRAGVGVLAAWDGVTRGEKVLVLVPTTDLQDRWLHTLELQLPGLSLGRRGEGCTHTFDDCDVLVSLADAATDDLLPCLLYTSDAADELDGVDLGGRRIIKKIFFSSRRRHTRCREVSWARRCV